jgi:hypothetical protein
MNLKLIELKLASWKRRYGEAIETLTPEDALKLAIDAESFHKDMSPFDQAKIHFLNEERNWTSIAGLLEQRQHLLKQEPTPS